jgi:hypothetical protein
LNVGLVTKLDDVGMEQRYRPEVGRTEMFLFVWNYGQHATGTIYQALGQCSDLFGLTKS